MQNVQNYVQRIPEWENYTFKVSSPYKNTQKTRMHLRLITFQSSHQPINNPAVIWRSTQDRSDYINSRNQKEDHVPGSQGPSGSPEVASWRWIFIGFASPNRVSWRENALHNCIVVVVGPVCFRSVEFNLDALIWAGNSVFCNAFLEMGCDCNLSTRLYDCVALRDDRNWSKWFFLIGLFRMFRIWIDRIRVGCLLVFY